MLLILETSEDIGLETTPTKRSLAKDNSLI